jgi:hypothetical protein
MREFKIGGQYPTTFPAERRTGYLSLYHVGKGQGHQQQLHLARGPQNREFVLFAALLRNRYLP